MQNANSMVDEYGNDNDMHQTFNQNQEFKRFDKILSTNINDAKKNNS